MKKYKIYMLILIVLIFGACATNNFNSDNIIYGIDPLVSEIASQAVNLIPADSNMTLAVYYFTVDGHESNISDYLITGLTTEIANLAGDGITIVSRQGLDRVMSEYSFMVSDLVSEETQVNIGELLGADVILIGFINPLEDYNKMNIQLLDVETGAVLGGFFLDYILETGFKSDSSSEIVSVQEGAVQTSGTSTVTTVYENFEGPVVNVNPVHYEEYWGDKILNVSAKTGTDDEGYGFLDFEANFPDFNMEEGWNDSDLTYYLNYKNDWSPLNQQGIAVTVYPENFTNITLIVQQPEGDEQKTFIVNMTLNSDEWTNLLIPFSSFKDITNIGDLDLSRPVSIGFGIPFKDNYANFNFRDSTHLQGRLGVDNLGFFKFKEPDNPGTVAAFEDEVLRSPGLFTIGGSDLYVDYTNSDDGILKRNAGIDWQYLESTIEDDGPSGRYLRLYGELEINDKILNYLAEDQEMYAVYRMSTGIDWTEFGTYSMLIKSDTFENCWFDISGNGTDQSYNSTLNFNSSWSRVKLPYSEIKSDMGTLKDTPLKTDQVWISFVFPFKASDLKKAVENGSLGFEIDIDQIVLKE